MSDRVHAATAEAIADDPALRECLYLLSKGVPFNVAFCLDATVRLAWCVILGELDGGVFEWARLEWRRES